MKTVFVATTLFFAGISSLQAWQSGAPVPDKSCSVNYSTRSGLCYGSGTLTWSCPATSQCLSAANQDQNNFCSPPAVPPSQQTMAQGRTASVTLSWRGLFCGSDTTRTFPYTAIIAEPPS